MQEDITISICKHPCKKSRIEVQSILTTFIGCSEPGTFGANCSIPCPDPHCLYCDSENGSCQGCKPGYQGHHCELGNMIFFKQVNSYFKVRIQFKKGEFCIIEYNCRVCSGSCDVSLILYTTLNNHVEMQ